MILNHVLNEKKSRTDEARNLGRSPRVGRLVAEVDHCGLRRGALQRNKGLLLAARRATTQPGGDAALLESEPASMIIAVVFAAAASAAPAAPVAPPSKPCVLHQPPPLRPSRCCSISVSAPLPGAASASSASSAALSGCWLLADAWCRRNILMLAVDDLRPLFGEAFGYPEVKTPNFDKNFLGEGLVFRTPLLPPHFSAHSS